MKRSFISGTLLGIWKAVVPARIRGSSTLYAIKKRLSGHNYVYSAEYFAKDVEGPATESAPQLSASIVARFNPRSIVDVGCGTGAFLAAMGQRGCKVFGLEYADAAIEFCHRRNLDVRKFDLEGESSAPEQKFDVAVSMEVAEHLPAAVADRYVRLLTSLAPVVVFTAATPGQGGVDHVNEQPREYWIEKFEARGHRLLAELTEQWKEEWRKSGKVASWYYTNLMVFEATAGWQNSA